MLAAAGFVVSLSDALSLLLLSSTSCYHGPPEYLYPLSPLRPEDALLLRGPSITPERILTTYSHSIVENFVI